ncbi:hypothetical protein ACFSJY_16545 [Thalassotalea euphylliae]|uniref:hypothetical protein n=1 Tax=Thalassotalea euphylliae TaxID=1655234 RepID=UPI003638AF96
MTITYEAHGNVDIIVDDNVIMIDAAGPWNDEFFPELHQQLALAVQHVDVNNYGVVLNVSGSAIASPASIEAHAKFVEQGRAKAVAVNMSECTSASISETLFAKVYRGAGLKYEFFLDSASAIAWINEQLSETK